jgi:hypothetical protein
MIAPPIDYVVGESIAALATSGLTECPLWVISGHCGM